MEVVGRRYRNSAHHKQHRNAQEEAALKLHVCTFSNALHNRQGDVARLLPFVRVRRTLYRYEGSWQVKKPSQSPEKVLFYGFASLGTKCRTAPYGTSTFRQTKEEEG